MSVHPDELNRKINELAARWISDGKTIKASVKAAGGVLWWKSKGDSWNFAFGPDSRGSTVAPESDRMALLTSAPLKYRLQAIMELPKLEAEIGRRLVGREKDMEDASRVLDQLLEEK